MKHLGTWRSDARPLLTLLMRRTTNGLLLGLSFVLITLGVGVLTQSQLWEMLTQILLRLLDEPKKQEPAAAISQSLVWVVGIGLLFAGTAVFAFVFWCVKKQFAEQ